MKPAKPLTPPPEYEEEEEEDVSAIDVPKFRAPTYHSLSPEKIASLAQQFAESLPTLEFTPAEIQGYLLRFKRDPVAAVDGAAAWVIEARIERQVKKEAEILREKLEAEKEKADAIKAQEKKAKEAKEKEATEAKETKEKEKEDDASKTVNSK
jgi:mitochondrial chaperone BCS1